MNLRVIGLCVVLFIILRPIVAQPCGQKQVLELGQEKEIKRLFLELDSALWRGRITEIDSISNELKEIYADQAGIPDAIEEYFDLTPKNSWLDKQSAVALSRELVDKDTAIYINLWKLAMGEKPPQYLPNSIFLRASAEIATGLLKFAADEPDSETKLLYEQWATKALDSLALMQLENGAFPFPDLRAYGDPVFSSIIQKFLNTCGDDSVNVLKNGWVVDDKLSGEFKFDAGVIADAYYGAYVLKGDERYKKIVLSIGDYLLPLKFNANYNYNSFVSLGLTRAFQLNGDSVFLYRALENIRYGVFPGQTKNGRWVDGHNASSRYHSIIIQNVSPTLAIMPQSYPHRKELVKMVQLALRGQLAYSANCGVATGFRWLLKAVQLQSPIVAEGLKDSLNLLIGRHINQAQNGNYLDVPSLGEYFDVLRLNSNTQHVKEDEKLMASVYPNPSTGIITLKLMIKKASDLQIDLVQTNGVLVNSLCVKGLIPGKYTKPMDLSSLDPGVYIIRLYTAHGMVSKKLVIGG